MAVNTPIFLLGFMGAGKSTVGPLLSEKLGRAFVDLDSEIKNKNSQSIAALFAQGEDVFRRAESNALCEVSKTSAVIATGGGIVLRTENLRLMNHAGLTIYLHVELEEIIQRLTLLPDLERPLLTHLSGQDLIAKISSLYKTRQPLYKTAKLHIDATQRSKEEIVEEIVRMYFVLRPEETCY